MKKKILIIRFSSFGDIVHCMASVEALTRAFPDSEIHWLVREDLISVVSLHPSIFRVHAVDREEGLLGLLKTALNLRQEDFDLIYDAHDSLRSKIVRALLGVWGKRLIIRRKKRLFRFLFFKFHLNVLPRPFMAMRSYQEPLQRWGISLVENKTFLPFHFSSDLAPRLDQEIFHHFTGPTLITLVPSAAWNMKKWPMQYWLDLIGLLPDLNFVVLGGPEDYDLQQLETAYPTRVKNMAGKLTIQESCAVIARSALVVSGDTGLLQVADFLNIPGIALIGPTAFGYPSGNSIKTLEVTDLKCKPCSKDGSGICCQSIYQKCLVDLSPQLVAQEVLLKMTRS